MARKKIDISIRLQRQEKKILELTDQLNAAKDEYEKLLIEQKEAEKEKLLEAYVSIPGDFTPLFRKMETGIPE